MKIKLILLIIIAYCTFACSDHCEKGTGREESQSFTVPEFEGIDISTTSDVEVIQSNEYKFEIEAQPNVIDQFRYHVRNKVLYIKSDCFNARSHPKIQIYCKDLNLIHFSGAGKVESSSTFISESFEIDLSGAANISLKGITENLRIKVSGSGDVDVKDLISKNCEIKISGSSKCKVNVTDELDVKISGSGDVFYLGNPQITQKISGSGSVKSLN